MMAIFIAASGGIAVGLAVGGLFGWFSYAESKTQAMKDTHDIPVIAPYRSIQK